VAAVTVAHTSALARFNTRSTADTLASKTDTLAGKSVPFAMTAGALAADAAAFAMDATALSMDGLSILRVQRRMTGPVRVANEPAEVKPVVVGNFAPALTSLVHRHDVVEALARCISQQVGILQFTITEPRRRPLGLQRIDGNSGFVGDPRQHRSTRRSGAE